MAVRPVFEVSCKPPYCVRKNIEFEFFSGFSDKQQRRCIHSLHQAYLNGNHGKKVLEISSKSEEELGVALSAFHLSVQAENGKEYSVESLFQASKVFEQGGPYVDLLGASPKDAKKDGRLKSSGAVTGFCLNGEEFGTEPKTYFYDWLYINVLHQHPELTEKLMEYDAFTDIAFNPNKSINCQAEAAAVYVSLQKQGMLGEALKSKGEFRKIVFINQAR